MLRDRRRGVLRSDPCAPFTSNARSHVDLPPRIPTSSALRAGDFGRGWLTALLVRCARRTRALRPALRGALILRDGHLRLAVPTWRAFVREWRRRIARDLRLARLGLRTLDAHVRG